MKQMATFLMFDRGAEEAVHYYVSLFPDAKIIHEHGAGGLGYMVEFELQGHQLKAFNGGPEFKFEMGVSLFVTCETQAEVDRLWEKLPEGGGQTLDCGWVRDRFGMYWQIVPDVMVNYLNDPDPHKAKRATDAMLKMTKLDIAKLTKAYKGEE